MTTDELKKEAEEYATKRASKLYTRNMWDRYYQTYIDSAKPREKEIKSLGERCLQLQKDKDELIDKTRELERKIASIRGSHRVDLAKLNARIEQVERLKKENAELKEKVNILDNCDRLGDVITEAYKDQLTKAKELLKRCYENYIYLEPLRSEIEQFLNSEVEK